jgi:PAS domain S-box-containing protein
MAQGTIDRLKTPAMALLALVLAATLLFWILDIKIAAEPPYLVFVLNLLFIGIAGCLIAIIAARGFLRTGAWAALWLGVGALTFALSTAGGSFLFQVGDSNVAITVHNTLVFIAALLFACGSFFATNNIVAEENGPSRLGTLLQVYLSAVVFCAFFAIAGIMKLLPPFFIEGQGGTPVRQIIVGIAAVLFLMSGLAMLRQYYRGRSSLIYWYSLGLILISLGMLGILMQTVTGTPLNWMGRISQLFAGLYLLAAALVSVGEGRARHVPAGEAMAGLLNETRAKLKESEERYRLASAASNEPIWEIDLRTGQVTWNDAYALKFGRPPETGNSWQWWINHIQQDERESVSASLKAAIESDSPTWERQYRFLRADGVWANIHDHSFISHDSNGKPVRVVGSMHDMTSTKKAEEELRQSEEKYRSLNLTMNEGLALHEIVYGDDGRAVDYRIVDINPAFEKITGLDRGKTLGMKASELYGTGKPPYFDIYERVAATGKAESFETFFEPMQKYFSISVFSPARGSFATVFSDVTVRKTYEERLKTSEERLRLAVRGGQIGIYEWNITKNTVFWSLETYDLFGIAQGSPATFQGWLDVVHPDDRPGIRDSLAGAVKATQNQGAVYSQQDEYRVVHSDGDVLWLGATTSFEFNSGDIVVRGIVRDITQRKKTEDALKESEAKANAMIKYAPTGIYELDFAGSRFISVNDAMCILSGYTREELFALGPAAMLDVESRKLFAERIKRKLAGEPIDETVEYTVIRKDGSKMFVTLNVAFALDGSSTALVIGHDITERKKAEEARKNLLEKYSALFSNTSDGVWIHDLTGKIVEVNEAYCLMSGYLREELLGMPVSKLEAVETPASISEHIGKVISRGGHDRFDSKHRRKDGSLFDVDITALYLEREGGQIAIFVRDITERKKVEQMKDEFIGMVSHEIKTPLTVIIGSLAVAMDEGVPESEARDLIRSAFQYAENLAGITENLLELSRYQSNRLNLQQTESDIAGITLGVIEKLRTRSSLHKLVMDVPETIPPVVVDPLRIERVIYNLVENAIKYSPRGGEVKILARVEDSQVVIGVRDNGIGISAEDQLRLFKSFERLDAYEEYSIPGLGLGLRVCETLVGAHGGRIWLESEKGKGSTFYFSIPLKK